MLVALLMTVQLSVETDPVGYLTFTAADAVDTKFGLPMEEAKVLATSVVSVTSGTVTVSVDASVVSNAHYLQFSSGALAGQWFEVSSSTADSVTVAEDLQSLGAAASDTFKIVPFWTLSSLFGTNFAVSTDIFTPVAQVLGNDVLSVGVNKAPVSNYAYHDGSSFIIGAGWFDVSDLSSKDDQKLAPNTFITIRNISGSEISLVVPGAVPTVALSTGIASDAAAVNDNLVYNPYPAVIELGLSSLQDVVDTSSDPFYPLTQVVVYESFDGINPSPTANYAYHDGSSLLTTGWFDVSNPFAGDKATVTIPEGGAFIIRKGAGTPSAYWTASLPYTL
jgi:uncharacterized protein (TIGR02597 family)